ncbi:MAG: DUF1801 domain-containing protein [Mycetocola sp.]
MEPSENIDQLITDHPDWRGAALAEARELIRAVDPAITEEWKWRGAPTWELDGILIVAGLFKKKVKLGFMHGASLPDPEGIFNGELGGNQRRSYELAEGDVINGPALQGLVREAITRNQIKRGTVPPSR